MGEKIDNRSRIDVVRAQEELIKSEQDQRDRKEQLDSEKDRMKELVNIYYLVYLIIFTSHLV